MREKWLQLVASPVRRRLLAPADAQWTEEDTEQMAGRRQFSLRELLMLTLIVGLALTVWRLTNSRELKRTTFFDSFDFQRIAQAIQSQVGLTGNYGGGGGMSSSPMLAIKEFDYAYGVDDPSQQKKFMTALHARIGRLLDQSKCRITGRGIDGNPGKLTGFSFVYRHDKTVGVLRADSYTDQDRLRVVVHAIEFPAP